MLRMFKPLPAPASAGNPSGHVSRGPARRPGAALVAWPLLFLVGLLPLAGCSKGGLPPLTPVKGKVTVNEQSLTGGQVTFIPLAIDKDSKVGFSTGNIKASGDYELFTEGQAGAPTGKYKVTITPPMMPSEKGGPKTSFDKKYMDQAITPLRQEVPSGSYDLKLK